MIIQILVLLTASENNHIQLSWMNNIENYDFASAIGRGQGIGNSKSPQDLSNLKNELL